MIYSYNCTFVLSFFREWIFTCFRYSASTSRYEIRQEIFPCVDKEWKPSWCSQRVDVKELCCFYSKAKPVREPVELAMEQRRAVFIEWVEGWADRGGGRDEIGSKWVTGSRTVRRLHGSTSIMPRRSEHTSGGTNDGMWNTPRFTFSRRVRRLSSSNGSAPCEPMHITQVYQDIKT